MRQGPLFRIQKDVGVTFIESDGWAVPTAFQSPVDELMVLQDSVGLVDLTGWGVVQLRGSSRLDFVQRLSTNDVRSLTPGHGSFTVFLTPIGRIVDLAFVCVGEDDLLLLVGRGADEVVVSWLRRHIFFNDHVLVENLTEQYGLMGLCGARVVELAEKIIGPEAAQLNPFHAWTGEIGSADVLVIRAAPLGNEYLLLTRAEQAPAVWSALATAVESVGGATAGEMALETARIENGWPRYGRELGEDYIPLEAGLKSAISFNKGCYVGQEVIARMETHQRLAKRLVVLGCDCGAGDSNPDMAAGDEVWADETRVGQITSTAPLADQAMLRALAYIKTGVAEPGSKLTIVSGSGELAAEVLAVSGGV